MTIKIKKANGISEPKYREHHILPAADYPEYADNINNLIKIDDISHALLHGWGKPGKGERLEVINEVYEYAEQFLKSKGVQLQDLIKIYEENGKKIKTKRINKQSKIYPPFSHHGNKAKLFGVKHNFRQYLPNDFDSYTEYIEPFAGSAGVFYELVNDGSLNPEQHKITLNDYDIVTYTMHRGVMECEPYEIKEVWNQFEQEVRERFIKGNPYGMWMHNGPKKSGRERMNDRDFKIQKNWMDEHWKIIQRKLIDDKKAYRDPETVAWLLTFRQYSNGSNFYDKLIGSPLNITRVTDRAILTGKAAYPKYKNNLKPLHDKLNEFKDGAGIRMLKCDFSECEKLYDIEPLKSFWYIDPPYLGTVCKYKSTNIIPNTFVDLLYKLHEKYAHFTFSIDSGRGSGYDKIQRRIKGLMNQTETGKYDKSILNALNKNIKVAEFSVKTGLQSWNSTITSKTIGNKTKERGEGVLWNW
jgi:site-specific DNA-adenine methylase